MKNKIVYILLAVSLILNIANFAYTYDLKNKTGDTFYDIMDYIDTITGIEDEGL